MAQIVFICSKGTILLSLSKPVLFNIKYHIRKYLPYFVLYRVYSVLTAFPIVMGLNFISIYCGYLSLYG